MTEALIIYDRGSPEQMGDTEGPHITRSKLSGEIVP